MNKSAVFFVEFDGAKTKKKLESVQAFIIK